MEELDRFTFRVKSEAKSGSYFVDALANNGKGQCDCADFQCRIAPIYAGTKKAPTELNFIASCKHQLRVKLYIAEQLIQNICKQHRERNSP